MRDPEQADAWNMLGVLEMQSGNNETALDRFFQAARLEPHNHLYSHNAGLALLNLERYSEAVAVLKSASEVAPGDLSVWFNLARAFNGCGSYEDALNCFEKVASANPDDPAVLFHMGISCLNSGRFEASVIYLERAAQHQPNEPLIYYNLALAADGSGELDSAIELYRRALSINPVLPEAHLNLGLLYERKNLLNEAEKHFTEASRLNPGFAEAWFNLGNIKRTRLEHGAAVACYNRAVQLKPDYPAARLNLGLVLASDGRVGQAVDELLALIKMKPDFALAYQNLSKLYNDIGEMEKAVQASENAVRLKPDLAAAVANLFLLYMKTCNWAGMNSLKSRLETLDREAIRNHAPPPSCPFLSVISQPDPELNFQVARLHSLSISRTVTDVGLYRAASGSGAGRDGRIKVGYVSNDFFDHATAHLMLSMFELHDRRRFEIHAYNYGPDDGSLYASKIRRDCDFFHEIGRISDKRAAEKIANDQIDILVDLKGYTRGGRLGIFAWRPAPVQAAYLGFPGTTGASFIDYIITDGIVTPPEHDRFYSEKIVRLPHCYQVNDFRQPVSPEAFERSRFGLPEEAVVFACFNSSYKMEPAAFECWMDLLRRIPESVLWLWGESDIVRKHLAGSAIEFGVSPDRIVFGKFMTKDKHLARLRLADIGLDTFTYNGHTTTSDALWAGVPVVTVMGTHFASRVSASLLKAAGLDECIAEDMKGYVKLAYELASEPDKLLRLKQKLAMNLSKRPLFDTPGFTRNLESAYLAMHERFRAGNDPVNLDITAERLSP